MTLYRLLRYEPPAGAGLIVVAELSAAADNVAE